jgi:hypothetical protein
MGAQIKELLELKQKNEMLQVQVHATSNQRASYMSIIVELPFLFFPLSH